MDNPFSIFLAVNSFFLLLLIFNQNEVNKDLSTTQSSTTSPIEQATWLSLSIQFGILLFQTKLANF